MLEAAVNIEWFPSTWVVEIIGEIFKSAIVEHHPALAVMKNERLVFEFLDMVLSRHRLEVVSATITPC